MALRDDEDECRSGWLTVERDFSARLTKPEQLKYALQCIGRNPSVKVVERYWTQCGGSMSYEQFCVVLRREKKTSMGDLMRAFKMIDRSGDGYITAEELHRVLTKRGEKMTHDEVQSIIDEADYNGDGKLDYAEFCHMLLSTSEDCLRASRTRAERILGRGEGETRMAGRRDRLERRRGEIRAQLYSSATENAPEGSCHQVATDEHSRREPGVTDSQQPLEAARPPEAEVKRHTDPSTDEVAGLASTKSGKRSTTKLPPLKSTLPRIEKQVDGDHGNVDKSATEQETGGGIVSSKTQQDADTTDQSDVRLAQTTDQSDDRLAETTNQSDERLAETTNQSDEMLAETTDQSDERLAETIVQSGERIAETTDQSDEVQVPPTVNGSKAHSSSEDVKPSGEGQTSEAGRQTSEAGRQTSEAGRQTSEAGRQTDHLKTKGGPIAIPEDFSPLKRPVNLETWNSITGKGCCYLDTEGQEEGVMKCHHYRLNLPAPTQVWIEVGVASPGIPATDILLFVFHTDDDEKPTQLITCTQHKIEQHWVCSLDLAAGSYALIPFSSGCHLKPRESMMGEGIQLVVQEGGKTRLGKKCRSVLEEVFHRMDLDGNGFISRNEFDFFHERTSGEICDDAAWRVIQDNFELTPYDELTLQGFLELHVMTAEDEEGGEEEIAEVLAALGYNKQLELDQACPFELEVFTEDCEGEIEIVDLLTFEPIIAPVLSQVVMERGVCEDVRDGREGLQTYTYTTQHMSTIVVENKGLTKVSVQLDCSRSTNSIVSRESSVHVLDVPTHSTVIGFHLMPENTAEPYVVHCIASRILC